MSQNLAPLVKVRTRLSGPGTGSGIVRGGVRGDGDELQALDVEHGRQEVREHAQAAFPVRGIFAVLEQLSQSRQFPGMKIGSGNTQCS